MLSIAGLNGWFGSVSADGAEDNRVQVLHDVSLEIGGGETVALVGESGSGKSVTALTVLRLLEEGTSFRASGSIRFEGRSLLDLPLDQIRPLRGNRVAMIFQEPMTSLNPVYTVGSQIVEPLQRHRNLEAAAARAEAIRLLERTGLEDGAGRFDSYPHQLSGGQRQRVMIAMALSCRPALLIADEPTTALDVTTQAAILALIADIQREFRMAMLLITHDLPMVRRSADRIYIMKDGRIVESGPAGRIFSTPADPYTRQLMAAIPAARAPRPGSGPALLETAGLNCSFALQRGWKNLLKRRVKTVRAVDDVSISVRRGTTCGIIGESGSGKTTLALALLRLIASSGIILLDGRDLQGLSRRELRSMRRRIQVVFQDPYSSLSPRMTVADIVGEGLTVHRRQLGKAERRRLVRTALEDVGLTADCGSRYPHEFSGGQRQRIAIARGIILRPEVLILDEPTSALDMTIQAQIIELLNRLQAKYELTYLFISHDLKVVRAMADFLVVMRAGRIVEQGEAAALFARPVEPYTKELFRAALG